MSKNHEDDYVYTARCCRQMIPRERAMSVDVLIRPLGSIVAVRGVEFYCADTKMCPQEQR